ncbi:hypothetical protein BJV82DRAFT_672648 [Fennellomyces sp. T-0311]|nr:hypothetical protein BJV82DRAFT_672648 [Fennellomyces sp. T-0311]
MAQSACLMPSPGDAFRWLTVTTLNFATMNDAFEQGKHAFETHDYHQAVEHYTSALKALQQDLAAAIFVHRAVAYEMQGKYESAVDDGRAANPYQRATRADPYLTLGNALFLSNQLRESAAVYKHGAEIVPETCSRHDTLITKHRQVQNAMEKQNQFIYRLLPFEVLSRILSMLSIKDRATLAITCRFWNNYIFKKWSYMWETIDTRKDLPDYPEKGAALIEAIHGDQVRNLTVEFEDPMLRYFF